MTAINTIVPRSTDPLDSVVLSINAINDGDAYNVIPSTIELRGSLRTISHQSRSECLARIDRMCAGTASTYDLKVDVTYMPVSPATVNHPGCVEAATAILTRAFGAERVLESDTVMGAEDFSYMLEKLPGCFIWIGNGDSAPLHSKHYDFSDEAIIHGMSAFLLLVKEASTHRTG